MLTPPPFVVANSGEAEDAPEGAIPINLYGAGTGGSGGGGSDSLTLLDQATPREGVISVQSMEVPPGITDYNTLITGGIILGRYLTEVFPGAPAPGFMFRVPPQGAFKGLAGRGIVSSAAGGELVATSTVTVQIHPYEDLSNSGLPVPLPEDTESDVAMITLNPNTRDTFSESEMLQVLF